MRALRRKAVPRLVRVRAPSAMRSGSRAPSVARIAVQVGPGGRAHEGRIGTFSRLECATLCRRHRCSESSSSSSSNRTTTCPGARFYGQGLLEILYQLPRLVVHSMERKVVARCDVPFERSHHEVCRGSWHLVLPNFKDSVDAVWICVLGRALSAVSDPVTPPPFGMMQFRFLAVLALMFLFTEPVHAQDTSDVAFRVQMSDSVVVTA